MGDIIRMKCRKCGNTWEHWRGIGFSGRPLAGSKDRNTTGDGDKEIRCPQCGSRDFGPVTENQEGNDITAFWD